MRTSCFQVMAAFALVAAAALAGCKSSGSSGAKDDDKGTPTNPVDKCSQEGQSCVHSQGKLGLCTQKLGGCDGGICFVCMSLH